MTSIKDNINIDGNNNSHKSKAKEIKEKKLLQSQLQVVFNKSRATVLKWIENDSLESKDNSGDLKDFQKEFYQLPVMATGASLDLSNTDTDGTLKEEDISTVGEFINGDKKVSTLRKKKMRNSNNRDIKSSIYRIDSHDSKAMVALKHKMREGKRKEIKKKLEHFNDAKTYSNVSATALVGYDDNNDEDEDDPKIQKTTKKVTNLPLSFGKKKKK
ncbi:uncharacterized protein SCODWIG_03785 [Saccharomycodes ludwigii]|uniref:Nucleolar protein 19 n=2 Tax=Saccharomycodes ludwigii TaxID=36035 RepID=A0A376BBG0_9ASCO|nr:uncharacterized protein SCODWIG_03785 [Saccharomycodes ludwigii]